MGDQSGTVRRILKRIADGAAGERDRVLAELFILAGLRKMTGTVEREAKKMPILNDIMDDEVIGPLIRQGRDEGRVEGRVEGQLSLLMRQIEKRFGNVPPTIRKRLTALKPAQLERVGLRLLDVARIEDLFGK